MSKHDWRYWKGVAEAAEKNADRNEVGDRKALMAAYSMVDSILEGHGVPEQTPELVEKLNRAEELAQAV